MYGKRDRADMGHNPTETGKRKTKKVRGKSDRNAAKMKTAATAAKVAKDKSAPRLNVASAHKNEHAPKYRLHTENKERTKIYYIHTHNTA